MVRDYSYAQPLEDSIIYNNILTKQTRLKFELGGNSRGHRNHILRFLWKTFNTHFKKT